MSNQYTGYKFNDTDIDDIKKMYQDGNSFAVIALYFKCKRDRIKKILIDNNLFINGRDLLKKNFSEIEINDILLHYSNGLSCQKIAKLYNMSSEPIKRILRNKNILRRGNSNGVKIILTEELKESIKKLYLIDYKNSYEISEILGFTPFFIDKFLSTSGYRRNKSQGTSIGMIKKYRGILYSYNQYLNDVDEFYRYKINVNRITNQQPINSLLNFNKRGKSGVNGAYHLDHRFSIMEGFKGKINPKIIGNINNLEFIPWIDNIKKRTNCSITKEELKIK